VKARAGAWPRRGPRRPKYAGLLRLHGEALLAAERTSADLKAFQDEVERKGLRFTLPILRSTLLGDLSDHHSQTRYWLRAAAEHGFPVPDPADYGLKQW
jgi:hypothetical protein